MIEVTTRKFPSYFFTKKEEALKKAKEHGVEVCKIIFEDRTFHNTNGWVSEQYTMGYGLYDGKLLETKDFITITMNLL